MFHGHLDCFPKPIFGASLTQNWETVAFQTLTIFGLFYFIMREDRHEEKYIEIAFGEEPVTCDFTLHLRVRDHTT